MAITLVNRWLDSNGQQWAEYSVAETAIAAATRTAWVLPWLTPVLRCVSLQRTSGDSLTIQPAFLRDTGTVDSTKVNFIQGEDAGAAYVNTQASTILWGGLTANTVYIAWQPTEGTNTVVSGYLLISDGTI